MKNRNAVRPSGENSLSSMMDAAKEGFGVSPTFLWGTRVKFVYYGREFVGAGMWEARWDNPDDGWKFAGRGDVPVEAAAWLEREVFLQYAPWHSRI